jgi:hypothetical protein
MAGSKMVEYDILLIPPSLHREIHRSILEMDRDCPRKVPNPLDGISPSHYRSHALPSVVDW